MVAFGYQIDLVNLRIYLKELLAERCVVKSDIYTQTLEVYHAIYTPIRIPNRELVVYACCIVVAIFDLRHLKTSRYQSCRLEVEV